jgi:microcystin-dependent protein
MSLTIYEPTRILNSNISANTLQTFFDVNSSRTYINGSVGIGTNQLLSNFHIENNSCPFKINISNENKIKSITYQTYYGLLPIGSIIIIPTQRLVTFLTNQGWLECNGGTYNLASYPLLEPLLRSTDYGNTTGVNNTFKVPNLVDRIPVGSDGIYDQTYYNTNSAKIITLTVQQLPNHSHSGISAGANTVGSHFHDTVSDGSRTDDNIETNTCCGGQVTESLQTTYTSGPTAQNWPGPNPPARATSANHTHDSTYSYFYNGSAAISLQRNIIYMIYMIKAK